MYYKIIRSLSRFIQTPSFFLSKLIRKSLNEDVFHLKQTKHYRYVGFKMLFIFSIILFTGIYSYAVFDFSLELNQSECTFEGDCKGTCPKCRQEEQKLSKVLLLKGSVVAASAAMLLTGCGIEPEDEFTGDVAIDENYEEIMLDGDVEYIGEDSEE